MADILCKWLNEEIHVEPKLVIVDGNLAEMFSNGYLFGEVLHKYDLQPDFHLFSKGSTSEAKLKNFTLLEPSFKLLEIPFTVHIARQVMTQGPGVATRLIYQLFLALTHKKECQLTTQTLECMRAPGKANLCKIETEIFQNQLKQQTTRQVHVNFEQLVQRYKDKHHLYDAKMMQLKKEEQERCILEKKMLCQKSIQNSQTLRKNKSEMYKKLKPLTSRKRAKSSPGAELPDDNQFPPLKSSVAEEMVESIEQFESSLKKKLSVSLDGDAQVPAAAIANKDIYNSIAVTDASESSVNYLRAIHQRVAENSLARARREKRRRSVLVKQMKVIQEHEEVKRETMLVERLMRQSQQEKRIATQLLHIRKEKDTIRNNRILRQQQYSRERKQEYIEDLNRRAGLALLEEEERKKRLKHHNFLYHMNLARKAKLNYQANYSICRDITLQILDFTTKFVHYRELTKNLVPAKIVQDWKTLFILGRPIYEEDWIDSWPLDHYSSMVTTTSSDVMRPLATNDQLLNDLDLKDYINGVNDWNTTSDFSSKLPLQSNPILSHAVYRVLDIVDPPRHPFSPPQMPTFILRACVLGKPFTGKTTVLKYLEKTLGLTILTVESVTKKAIEAYHIEWKKLQTQYSSPISNQDDLGEVLLSDNMVDGRCITPCITVNPHISVEILTSSCVEVGKEVTETGGQTPSQRSTIGQEYVMTQLSEEMMFQLSPLANLGCKAHAALTNGITLDDALLNDIIIQVIPLLPEGCGWIFDNFPTTLVQAKLLFSALTGQSRPRPAMSRDFVLLGASKRDESVLKASSGLDILLYFDASNDVILQRASMFAMTGIQDGNQLEQIHERLMVYNDNWRSIYRWCSRFKIVSTINTMIDIQSVCDTTAEKVQEAINNNKQTEAMKKLGFEEDMLASASVISLSSMSGTPKKKRIHPHSLEDDRRTSSAKLSLAAGKRLRSASIKTPEFSALVKECKKEQWNPVNLDVIPGGQDWQYYVQPIIEERTESLARKWPSIEATYINTLKQVFQMLRGEREVICEYFFLRRKQFSSYLCRPDLKQEFITQWQDHYNALQSNLYHEGAMKAELHHRVDDLMDKLWDISECRKSQADEERQRIAEERWLEDHIGLLSNHYISIMQVELDRFLDTVLFIKEYYNAMENMAPDKSPELGRLFLIKLPVTEPPAPPSSQTSSTHSVTQEYSSMEGNKIVMEEEISGKDGKTKIPMLPQLALSDNLLEEKMGRKKAASANVTVPSPINLSGMDVDKQLVNHVFNQGLTLISNLMSGEVKSLDSIIADCKPSIEKATEPVLPEPKEESLKRSREKKTKNQSRVNVKKGGKSSARKKSARIQDEAELPSIKPFVVTPDVIMQRQRTLHRCKEYKAVLLHEEDHVKIRLDIVRVRSLAMIDHLKKTERAMQEEMESWMAACYKQEVESVNRLVDMLRQTIENEHQLLYEITLPGAKFLINKDVITFVPVPSPSPPPPVEHPNSSYFTVAQLRSLFQPLQLTAPSGFILARTLVDILLSLLRSSSKDASLPLIWRDASKQQLEDIVKMLFGQNVDYVDWRRFLVCVAFPWPLPTAHQLVEAWTAIVGSADSQSSDKKMVNKKTFMATEIWLDQPPGGHEEEEEVKNVGFHYNRNSNLKETFVDIFCEKNGMLDLRTLLLYLCVDPQPKQGLYKALSVVTSTPLLSHQEVDASATVLLHDFQQVFTWSTYQDTEGIITEAELLDVFVQVDHSNPYEVSLAALLSHKSIADLLECHKCYHLPDFFVVLRANDGKLEP